MKNEHIHNAFHEAILALGARFKMKAIVMIGATGDGDELVCEVGGVNITVDDARTIAIEGAALIASQKPGRVIKKTAPQ